MTSELHGPTTTQSRRTYSCNRCADRKVKCDRRSPCGACIRHDANCIFQSLHPPPKKNKRVKVQTLTDRLQHYESLLRESGIDTSKFPEDLNVQQLKSRPVEARVRDEKQAITTSPSGPDSSQPTIKATVLESPRGSKIVNNLLWTRVAEEYRNTQGATEDLSSAVGGSEASDEDFAFGFPDRSSLNSDKYHPSSEQIQKLWDIFAERIDPLTKVVHVPTMYAPVMKAAADTTTIPRSFEAFLFAIYAAAVLSLSEIECGQYLGEDRKLMLKRYVSATNATLQKANFMGTTNLVVLQALVIHLHTIRDIYEPRVVWSLTGVAVRIAQGMGLDRDGAYLGLSPFETEIRRRLWWLLKTHDFRTAELCGVDKFWDLRLDAQSPRWPTNLDDKQLSVSMTSLPAASSTLTDAVFIAIKYELLNFAASRKSNYRRLGKGPGQWELHTPGSNSTEIDASLKEVEELLETKYLRYCDPSQPLHLMAMLMARCSMNYLCFLSHHPRRWANMAQTPVSERQKVWEVSLKLLEQHTMLQSSPQLKQFAWYALYFQPWHAIIHVLDTLQGDPHGKDAEKAWNLIGSMYENNPSMTLDMRKPIHIAVGSVCLRAYNNRESMLRRTNQSLPLTPNFIDQLRRRRDIARLGKIERSERRNQNGKLIGISKASSGTKNNVKHGTNLGYITAPISDQRNEDPYCSQSPQTGVDPTSPQLDAIWYVHGLEEDQTGENMHTDMNVMLDQAFSLEDNATHAISWDHWDSWLANSDLMHPLSP